MGRYRILVTQTFEYDAVEAETGEEALFAVKETVHALTGYEPNDWTIDVSRNPTAFLVVDGVLQEVE